jgi:fructokinase
VAGGPAVLGIGEILWDLLPSGPRLGGAPFNVVAHLRRLGHPVAYLTSVGDDDLGRRTLQEIRALDVDASCVQVAAGAPTATVGVTLDARGSPTFEIRSPAAYELTEARPGILDSVRRLGPRAVVFGTLAQRWPRVRTVTQEVLSAQPGALRVYDVNLRGGTWSSALVAELAREANVLKLNDDEVRVLGPALGLPAASLPSFAEAAARRFGLEAVCVTQGSAGAVLWTPTGLVEHRGYRVVVADTIGAGDAFTAGLVHAILVGSEPLAALQLANALGAIVASRPGAIPSWTRLELQTLWDAP